MPKPINLVLSGGGVNGIAHIGAITTLLKYGYLSDIKRVAGSSAGALISVAIALGFNENEHLAFMQNIDFPKLISTKYGYPEQTTRLFNRYGRYSARTLHNTVNTAIKKKLGIENATFSDFKHLGLIDLHVISVNMSRSGMKFDFCYDTTPLTRVADAVCASMAVPYYFEPVRLKKNSDGNYVMDTKDPDAELFVDGGTVDNFPIEIFDTHKYYASENNTIKYQYARNPQTLGLFIVDQKIVDYLNEEKHEPEKINHEDTFSFFKAVTFTAIFKQKIDALMSARSSDRVIFISDCNNDPMNFDLDDKIKLQLLESGKSAVVRYLSTQEKQRPMQAKL